MENINLISVVIPVYNTEKYLEQCIESVINQTYLNLEIILIDDGSTDNSGQICEEYAKMDSRIRVIHQENGGMIQAVNRGISLAKGRYLAFVDSDDWIELDMYEYMINEIGDNDLISVGMFLEYYDSNASNTHFPHIPEKRYAGKDDMEYIWRNMVQYHNTNELGIMVSRCVHLFRKDIVGQIYQERPINVVFGEDRIFMFMYLLNCESIKIVNRALYHYRLHNDSCTHTRDKFFLNNINEYYVFLEKYFSNYSIKDELICQLEYEVVNLINSAIDYRLGFKFYKNIRFEMPFVPELFENKKVVLYGAGKVGRDYHHQLIQNQKIKKIKWVDQRYEHYREKGMSVDCVEGIQDEEYDYIIIAVKREKMARDIENKLLETGVV